MKISKKLFLGFISLIFAAALNAQDGSLSSFMQSSKLQTGIRLTETIAAMSANQTSGYAYGSSNSVTGTLLSDFTNSFSDSMSLLNSPQAMMPVMDGYGGVNLVNNNMNDVLKGAALLTAEQALGLTGTVVVMAVWKEYKLIQDYCAGNISRSDLVYKTATNAALVVGSTFTGLLPVISVAFIIVDVSKQLVELYRTQADKTEFIITAVANAAGLAAGAFAVSALGSAAAAGQLGGTIGTIIGSPIGGVLVFAVVYGVTTAVIKMAGHQAVNIYEAYKEPERFEAMCDEIRAVCKL